MDRRHFITRASGFSLLEVMVAVIVICVGLLGIAKMQSLALSNTTVSRQRALAAFEAASMASAMHANRDYWDSFGGNFQLSIISNPVTVTVPADATLKNDIVADLAQVPSPNACIATAVGAALCTPQQLAAFDVARWWAVSLSPLLPNAGASIQCSPGPAGTAAPMSCQIQITWSEKAVAMNKQEAGQANQANVQFQTPTYTLYVQP